MLSIVNTASQSCRNEPYNTNSPSASSAIVIRNCSHMCACARLLFKNGIYLAQNSQVCGTISGRWLFKEVSIWTNTGPQEWSSNLSASSSRLHLRFSFTNKPPFISYITLTPYSDSRFPCLHDVLYFICKSIPMWHPLSALQCFLMMPAECKAGKFHEST